MLRDLYMDQPPSEVDCKIGALECKLPWKRGPFAAVSVYWPLLVCPHSFQWARPLHSKPIPPAQINIMGSMIKILVRPYRRAVRTIMLMTAPGHAVAWGLAQAPSIQKAPATLPTEASPLSKTWRRPSCFALVLMDGAGDELKNRFKGLLQYCMHVWLHFICIGAHFS